MCKSEDEREKGAIGAWKNEREGKRKTGRYWCVKERERDLIKLSGDNKRMPHLREREIRER